MKQLPSDWADHLRVVRETPSRFEIVEVQTENIEDWTVHLDGIYKNKLPLHIRKVIKAVSTHSALLQYRKMV